MLTDSIGSTDFVNRTKHRKTLNANRYEVGFQCLTGPMVGEMDGSVGSPSIDGAFFVLRHTFLELVGRLPRDASPQKPLHFSPRVYVKPHRYPH